MNGMEAFPFALAVAEVSERMGVCGSAGASEVDRKIIFLKMYQRSTIGKLRTYTIGSRKSWANRVLQDRQCGKNHGGTSIIVNLRAVQEKGLRGGGPGRG